METPSRHSFNCDGSLRVFPIPSPIKGDDYCRLEVDGVVINDKAKYDIVNNSIVFLSALDVPSGSVLDVLVVQSAEALGQLSVVTNIDLVAQDIANVNLVGNDLTNVDTVAGSIANVNTTSTNIIDVNTVANNMTGLVDVINNLPEVLLADDNAAVATTQAGIATAQAVIATEAAAAAALYTPTGNTTAIPLSSMLAGDLSLSNTIKTLEFDAITYTGNGTSQDIVTGMSTIDFTAASNGTGFYHDRVAGDCIVKNDAGTIVASGSIAFMDVAGVDGVCQVQVKNRTSIISMYITDGIRGVTKYILPSSAGAESTAVTILTAFTSTGFSTGASTACNANLATYVAYQTLYTHIKWGLTNQGKRYIEAYNPVTNDTMIMYQGSGVAGHEIPHSVGVALDFIAIKGLTAAVNWIGQASVGMNCSAGDYLNINTTVAVSNSVAGKVDLTTDNITLQNVGANHNSNNEAHILYGKANSKTWGIYPYTGTGVVGNFVETLDTDGIGRRPARVIIKAVSAVGNWVYFGNSVDDERLYLNLSNAGSVADTQNILANGFDTGNATQSPDSNATGVQYIALVEFDTDSTGTTGAYFDNPSATTQLQLTDGIYSVSDGYDANGAKNKVSSLSTTVTPTGGWL